MVTEFEMFLNGLPNPLVRASWKAKVAHTLSLDNETQINENMWYSNGIIYHYTNLNGLLGIIESDGIWLSNHRYLNDSEEYENGRKVAVNTVTEMASTIQSVEFKAILTESIHIISNFEESNYYIASFCIDGDSLDQWRSYANDGNGIAIKFDVSNSNLNNPPQITLSKIIYDDAEKSKSLLRIINIYQEECENEIAKGNTIDTNDWAKYLADELQLSFITFKNSAFASEKEIRAIARLSDDDVKDILKFRAIGNKIVPYVVSSSIKNSKKFTMDEVIVGPTANQPITIKSIKEFLNHKGHGNININSSKVPYRP